MEWETKKGNILYREYYSLSKTSLKGNLPAPCRSPEIHYKLEFLWIGIMVLSIRI